MCEIYILAKSHFFAKEERGIFTSKKIYPNDPCPCRSGKNIRFVVNEECSEKSIGSHSIQNNKVLKRRSSNGMVFMPCPKLDVFVIF